jgi:hypothetical protein
MECPVCHETIVIGAIADRIHETVRCPHCNALLEIYEEYVEDAGWEIQWLDVVEQ